MNDHAADTDRTSVAQAVDQAVDQAVAESGAYEVIRTRLAQQGRALAEQAGLLNAARIAEFGSAAMSVVQRIRMRTEHNCVGRDIARAGECLLLGYNVFIGLKSETQISDVFSLYRLDGPEGNVEFEPVPLSGTFLDDEQFRKDFRELYAYYKHTRLLQTAVKEGRLLASFQIGERLNDIRVFRWSVSHDGKRISYIDNRGERDIEPPPTWDFEWTKTTRDDIVQGRHAHINILDTVFVETIEGTLTVKIENNTEAGFGIYDEPVNDQTQSLDDADIHYAAIGNLILLRILPYREEHWRYLVYNRATETVTRIDAIGDSCVQLPEDDGLIFPGGYYLQTGEHKAFDEPVAGMRFKRAIRSPNGEDYLYIFYEPSRGRVALFNYNMISKSLRNPILALGYAVLEDGRIVVFPESGNEPRRRHSMQVWQTPFYSEEYASRAPAADSFYGRIGNAELVRGISDFMTVCRLIENPAAGERQFHELAECGRRLFDAYFWLKEPEVAEIAALLEQISQTGETVLDEYEKVESIRKRSTSALADAERDTRALIESLRPEGWQKVGDYVGALNGLIEHRGRLLTIREYRYIDTARIDQLEAGIGRAYDTLARQTSDFLASDAALQPYEQLLDELNSAAEAAVTASVLKQASAGIEQLGKDLELLSELMATLPVQDATQHTRIVESIAGLFARVNQGKARAEARARKLGSAEARAQFGAQFRLFTQGITNALGMADTPQACEAQLSRLLVQLEELESRYGEFEEFLTDILNKREELYEHFEARRQNLLDERQRKAQTLMNAADRILSSIGRRLEKIESIDKFNAFFASDPTAMKLREIAERLRALDDQVRAADIEARLKAARDQAVRALRDRTEIFEADGTVIRLGPRHRFNVNAQDLDLTIIQRGEQLCYHLIGTEYFEPVDDAELTAMAHYWRIESRAESAELYRGEFLAGTLLDLADAGDPDMPLARLEQALTDDQQLDSLVRTFAAARYREGYEKGIHDHDAARILQRLVPIRGAAGLLRFDPLARGLAAVYWANCQQDVRFSTWPNRARSAAQMQSIFARGDALALLQAEAGSAIAAFVSTHGLPLTPHDAERAAEYLTLELSGPRNDFVTSKYAVQLVEALTRSLKTGRAWTDFTRSLEELMGRPGDRWALTTSWLEALVARSAGELLPAYIPEAVSLINAETRVTRRSSEVDLEFAVTGLLGSHARIVDQRLKSSIDNFMRRYRHHRDVFVPEYDHYLQRRQQLIDARRRQMRLDELMARPLTTFVRNRLISEVYLPIIGDNLAKQIGVAGDAKRTDLMGLLMLISPPGYGKTTLMEYVAHRLGLTFMKINCPSLGHSVKSLDPAQAPNATARQEIEKLNLALEMRNNVMLYLDDIQHTDAEFLQKFISLCDATRRIEGVFRSEARTYDLRGKRFCIVMAGNPYTESGEVFRIPDMLANRADVYNLGDVLNGKDYEFALSYLENCLTSNDVLAPLATRSMQDVALFLRMAEDGEVSTNELSHGYSRAEIDEIVGVVRRLMRVRDVILEVNRQYIASAAQDDRYREEPPFKLQGSYRNMNKLAEAVSAVMNEDELRQLIRDHYAGEAQLLTKGAEENLLKLKELSGALTETEQQRWQAIKTAFKRNRAMGGDDAETGMRIVGQLVDLVTEIKRLGTLVSGTQAGSREARAHDQSQHLDAFRAAMEQLSTAIVAARPEVQIVNNPVPGINKLLTALADTVEHSIYPLLRVLDKKLEIDLDEQRRLRDVAQQLREIRALVGEQPGNDDS